MDRFYFDSETVGLVGVPLLFQYAINEEKTSLHYLFDEPVSKTLELIERMTKYRIVGFNLVYDWFHINKIYNILRLVENKSIPPIIKELRSIEDKNPREWCVKPVDCVDLYTTVLKGPYQSVMDRKPIYIRRIPISLADSLINRLDETVKFRKLFFARLKNKEGGWEIQESVNSDGTESKDLVDLVLRFRPSAGLKILIADIKGIDTKVLNEIIEVPYHEEEEWRPWGWDWSTVINDHLKFWKTERAIQYASDDIIYTRDLDKYCNYPEPDDDSILSCMVGAVRWHGYSVNKEQAERLEEKYNSRIIGVPQSPNEVKQYLRQFMSPIEQLTLTSSKKVVLEGLEKWEAVEGSEEAESGDFLKSNDTDIINFLDWTKTQEHKNEEPHPVAIAAHKVLEARRATKRIDIINKLRSNNWRLFPNFRIIGAKSGRKSGSGGLNAQGIPREKEFREIFSLHDSNYTLDGGDFISFEIVIADAVYDDPVMREELKSGKKFHACFGAEVYASDYETIKNDKVKYGKAKNGVFGLLYGAQAPKIADTLGISLESAEEGYQRFIKKYKKVGESRAKTIARFCSMSQPGGIGTKVKWSDPDDYIETKLGFKRYFTLENSVCKALFFLANDLPEDIKNSKIKVIRRDRMQTGSGAICSALYGAAFNIQAQNMRAAANHEIQGTGAGITKAVEVEVWKLQPIGINNWIVIPMQIHDEIMSPTNNSDLVKSAVMNRVESFKSLVPLIGIDWMIGMKSWAEKG